jgi:hypothetical protein
MTRRNSDIGMKWEVVKLLNYMHLLLLLGFGMFVCCYCGFVSTVLRRE